MAEFHYVLSDAEKSLVAGDREINLKSIEAKCGVQISVRHEKGYKIISEIEENVSKAIKALDRLRLCLQQGATIDKFMVKRVLDFSDPLTKNLDSPEFDASVVIMRNRLGQSVQAKTEGQLELVSAVENHDIIFANGPAGTGKTFLAVALAVAALENKEVERICLVRPAVEAGENLGFLPGDLKEKIAPYLRPIYDSLQELLPKDKLRTYSDGGVIEIAPLAYMRGRTLKRAFIILDEAQNTTIAQMKMFLTRIGPHSKAIITGDESQIDLGPKSRSGLSHALLILKNVKGISQVHLKATEVLRHRLVQKIIAAYENVQEV